MLWKADPTFYPSQKLAAQARHEKLAYVAAFNAKGDSKPDALIVVDVDPSSRTYGQIAGRTDMPNAGDELHHFGWNACSSALCPYAAHPHLERRYLIVRALLHLGVSRLKSKELAFVNHLHEFNPCDDASGVVERLKAKHGL